jgi:(5-formylfuran-3-yl)methyl phosphate synthase
MPPTRNNESTPKLTRLLVSVRSAAEAEICLRSGVDWIDVKEPSAGSLGAPALQIAQTIANCLRDFPHRSVALGELATLNRDSAIELSKLFPVAKVGLSQTSLGNQWRRGLDSLAEQIGAQLVAVAYADWKECHSPSPESVLDWACSNSSQFMLIDTYFKNGKTLVDHLSVKQLEELVFSAQESCVGVVLAGSLSPQAFAAIRHIPCSAFAVRGAVCRETRNNSIDEELVQQWVDRIRLAGD